jgi:hypothetical protein
LTNTTVSGNQAVNTGAGLFNEGEATIRHTTIADNRVSSPSGTGGGLASVSGAILNIENSIIASNNAGSGQDLIAAGTINASGANLIGSNQTVEAVFPESDPLVGTLTNSLDPQLNALGSYGGPTPTMLPSTASPAINATTFIDGSTPLKDQRGVERPDGVTSNPDVGAVERTAADVDPDNDGDSIVDLSDNCILVHNQMQLDTDGDGYGNMCDGDLNNDGRTNTLDLNLYKQAHRTRMGDANYNADADFNGDAVINTLDLNIYKGLHRKLPGPSCCGSFP